MEQRNKKYVSMFVAITCSLVFLVMSVSTYKTGIISDIGPNSDPGKYKNCDIINRSDTIEGIFVDSKGNEITSYTTSGEPALSNYPESFSYLIGYNSSVLGLSGLRGNYCRELFEGENDKTGGTIHLTTNASIQERLYNLLEGSIGSINVVNANTGEIVALTSRGDPYVGYNVNLIDDVCEITENKEQRYFEYYNSIDGFWHNRSILAEDPPGSTAKMITAVSLVENGKGDMIYDDIGVELDGTVINYGGYAYGTVNLESALNNSINTYFARAGVELGNERLKRTFNNFMIGRDIELDFTTLKSSYSNSNQVSDYVLGSNAFGQGELIMSPLHIAMSIGAIMNEGTMMKPYLINQIVDDEKPVYTVTSELLSEATDATSANEVKRLLHSNAEYYGLYDYFSKYDCYIAAKTGTAEVSGNKGFHIYIALGVEINGVPYGICIDQANTQDVSSTLINKAIDTIDILLDELK